MRPTDKTRKEERGKRKIKRKESKPNCSAPRSKRQQQAPPRGTLKHWEALKRHSRGSSASRGKNRDTFTFLLADQQLLLHTQKKKNTHKHTHIHT